MNQFILESDASYFAEFKDYKAYSSNILTPLQNFTITYNKIQVYVTSATQKVGDAKLIQKQNQPCLTFTSQLNISPKSSPYLPDLSSFFNVQFKNQTTTTEGLNYTSYFPVKATQLILNFMLFNENIQLFKASCNISRPFKFGVDVQLPGQLIWLISQAVDSKSITVGDVTFTPAQIKQIALNYTKKHFQQPYDEFDEKLLQGAQKLQPYKGVANIQVFVTKCQLNDFQLSQKFGISTTSAEHIGISLEELKQEQVYGEKSQLKRLMVKGCQTWEMQELPKILYFYKFAPFQCVKQDIKLNIIDGKIQFLVFGQNFTIEGLDLLNEKQKEDALLQEQNIALLKQKAKEQEKAKADEQKKKIQEEKLKQEAKNRQLQEEKQQKQQSLQQQQQDTINKQEEASILEKQAAEQKKQKEEAEHIRRIQEEQQKAKDKQKQIVQAEIERQKQLRKQKEEDEKKKKADENDQKKKKEEARLKKEQDLNNYLKKKPGKDTGKLVAVKQKAVEISSIKPQEVKKEPEVVIPKVDPEIEFQKKLEKQKQEKLAKQKAAIQQDERLSKFQEAREADALSNEQLRKLIIQKEKELEDKKVKLILKIRDTNDKQLVKIRLEDTQKRALSDDDIEKIVEKECEKDIQNLHALKIKLQAKEHLTEQMRIQLEARLKEKEELEEKRKLLDERQKQRQQKDLQQKKEKEKEDAEFVARFEQEMDQRKQQKQQELEEKKQLQIQKQKQEQALQATAHLQAIKLQEEEKLAKERRRQEIMQKIERQNQLKRQAQLEENARKKLEMEELEKRKFERTQRLEEKKTQQQLLQNDLREEQRRIKLLELENAQMEKENLAKERTIKFTREIKTDDRTLRVRRIAQQTPVQDETQDDLYEENLRQRRQQLADDFEKTQQKLQKCRDQALRKIAEEDERRRLEREDIARVERQKYELQRERELLAERELEQKNIESEIARQQQIIEKQAFVQIKAEKWKKFWEVEEQKRAELVEKSKVYSPTRENAKISCFMEMPKLVCVQLGETGKVPKGGQRAQSSFTSSKWQ